MKGIFKKVYDACESYKHETSKVILLREVDDDGFPMVAICRQDKSVGRMIFINEITSIYDKQNLSRLISATYEMDKMFFKNKKIEQYIRSIGYTIYRAPIAPRWHICSI